jgi:hypothetical protein
MSNAFFSLLKESLLTPIKRGCSVCFKHARKFHQTFGFFLYYHVNQRALQTIIPINSTDVPAQFRFFVYGINGLIAISFY